MNEVFNRIEKKYILNKEQLQELQQLIDEKMDKDTYHEDVYTIASLYLDTDNYDLIRRSLDKPNYKEKVRLRCYGKPKLDENVFLEIKKKYNKCGNKRRIKLKLEDAYEFIKGNIKPKSQVGKELEYTILKDNLKPKIYIAYDRVAYEEKENKNLRITLDFNIRYRTNNLNLEYGDKGEYLEKNICIMEVKSNKAIPLWLVKKLSELKLYSQSFSKYGNIYQKLKKEGKI